MTNNELGKHNYDVFKTFEVFKKENKTITPWEDLTRADQEPWIVAALEVVKQTPDPDVSFYKRAAELKVGEMFFGGLAWMNGPEQVTNLNLSYDLKMICVQTMDKFGNVSLEHHELEKMVEVGA